MSDICHNAKPTCFVNIEDDNSALVPSGALGQRSMSVQVTGRMRLAQFLNAYGVVKNLLNRCTLKLLTSTYSEVVLKSRDVQVCELNIDKSTAGDTEQYCDRAGSELSVCYVGDLSNLEYLQSILFDGPVDRVSERPLSFLEILAKRYSYIDTDITVVDLDFPVNRLGAASQFSVPNWIKQKVELPPSWASYLSLMRRKTRREALRMIRKFNLTACVVPGKEYAEDFYHDLYVPYITSRHGDASIIIDKDQFVRNASACDIVKLIYQGNVVGAAQLTISDSTMAIGWTGIDDSNTGNDMRGAADALDLFCMKYAFDMGCRTVDMGHSRANLADGILRYKSKWAAKLSCGLVPQRTMSFYLNRVSLRSRKVFTEQVFMTQSKRRLEGHMLLPGSLDESSLEALAGRMFVEGLSLLTLYVAEEQLDHYSAEGPSNVRVVPYIGDQGLIDCLTGRLHT